MFPKNFWHSRWSNLEHIQKVQNSDWVIKCRLGLISRPVEKITYSSPLCPLGNAHTIHKRVEQIACLLLTFSRNSKSWLESYLDLIQNVFAPLTIGNISCTYIWMKSVSRFNYPITLSNIISYNQSIKKCFQRMKSYEAYRWPLAPLVLSHSIQIQFPLNAARFAR